MSDHVLDGHTRQTVPALRFRYVPAAHCKHSDDPFTPLNVPGKHATHLPPFGPLYPALQRHPSASELPLSELDRFPDGHVTHSVPPLMFRYVPSLHRSQAEEPLLALNSPGKHATHCPPSGPLYPALQTQSDTSVLPCNVSDLFPEGHDTHAVPPVIFRYSPALHALHSDDPLIALNSPAAHATH